MLFLKKLNGKKGEEYYEQYGDSNDALMHSLSEKRSIIFSERDIVASGFEGVINVIFSDGKLDLTKMKAPINSRSLKLNIVFSDAKIRIPEHIPVLVKINTIFSDLKQPKDRKVSFPGFDYVSKGFVDGQPYIEIRIQGLFSDIKIIPEEES